MREDFERIRKDVKALAKAEGLKVSVTTEFYSGGRSIDVAVLSAPHEMLYDDDGYLQVNQYYIETSDNLTRYGKEICGKINELIKKEHWDKSDSQTDYFHCAFYYQINVGKWDRPFVCTGESLAA